MNIGNAAIYGLQKDLKLKGNEFNAALTVFFVPYVIFEIPSNIILKRLRPHVWCKSAKTNVAAYTDSGSEQYRYACSCSASSQRFRVSCRIIVV